MFRYLLTFAVATCLAVGALCATPAQKEKAPTREEPVKTEFVKFVKAELAKDKKSGMMRVGMVGNNREATLPFAFENENDASALVELKGGEYLNIDVTKRDNKPVVTAFTLYELKPGEDEENVYIFKGTTEDKTHIVVKATKLGKDYTFIVPSIKEKDRVVPKPDFQAVTDLTDGDSVEIQASGTGPSAVAKVIRKYEEPKIGTFVKQSEETVEKVRTTKVVLKDDNDAEQTLPLQARNPGLLAKLKKFKFADGDKVQYRTADEKGTLTLIDIKPVPKDATSKPSHEKKEKEEKPKTNPAD